MRQHGVPSCLLQGFWGVQRFFDLEKERRARYLGCWEVLFDRRSWLGGGGLGGGGGGLGVLGDNVSATRNGQITHALEPSTPTTSRPELELEYMSSLVSGTKNTAHNTAQYPKTRDQPPRSARPKHNTTRLTQNVPKKGEPETLNSKLCKARSS